MLVDTETIVIVKDGINGISYSVDAKSDNVIGTYSGDNISYSGTVEFYVTKIISNVSSEYLDTNDVVVKAYLGGAVSNETAVQYDQSSHLWSINVNNTPSAFVLISVTEKTDGGTGMFYTSSVIPFITPGKDGSYSAPQTLKGGPLRMRGTWVSGTEYFDGTVATSDGIMYQDVVVYNNVYYVCLNSEELRKNNWLSTPSSVSYWQQIAFSDSFISEYLIANKGFIKELSSEEVVIMDNDEIVAGMTSSKAIDDKSDLNGKVTDKGDVRIWAGKMQTSGNLASAATTINSDGVIVSQNIKEGKYIKIDPNDCALKMVGPSHVMDGSDLPSGNERTTLVDFRYSRDADSLTSYPKLTLTNGDKQSYISMCPNMEDFGINIKGDLDSNKTTQITNGTIVLGDSSIGQPNPMIFLETKGGGDSIATFQYSNSAYVDISFQAGGGKFADKLIFVLKGLPTSNPHVNGALYTDSSGNLKVSQSI